MNLIVKSFLISFDVMGRMIRPSLVIIFAAGVIWGILNSLTLGYAEYVATPITAAFFSLYGIHTAQNLQGQHPRPQLSMLAVTAVLFGVIILVAKTVALALVDITAVIYANVMLGETLTMREAFKAEDSLKLAFAVYALSAKVVLALFVYVSVYVVMAIPLANAARAAGQGTGLAGGMLHGFGRQFAPLFCVFAVSIFLQLFFQVFTLVFTFVPLILGLYALVFKQTLPEVDLAQVALGVVAIIGLLWLHAWMWAASALALKSYEESDSFVRETASATRKNTISTPDIRSLRKSRE